MNFGEYTSDNAMLAAAVQQQQQRQSAAFVHHNSPFILPPPANSISPFRGPPPSHQSSNNEFIHPTVAEISRQTASLSFGNNNGSNYRSNNYQNQQRQPVSRNNGHQLTDYNAPIERNDKFHYDSRQQPVRKTDASPLNIQTPTVELNALAMKFKKQVKYVDVESAVTVYNPAKNQYERQANSKFEVIASLGDTDYRGRGTTRQSARHDAAAKAVHALKFQEAQQQQSSSPSSTIQSSTNNTEMIKSPISRLYEIAARKKLDIEFEVVEESGPAHMKQFVTRCRIGDQWQSEGRGKCKKSSKMEAAACILAEERFKEELAADANNGSIRSATGNARKVEDPEFGIFTLSPMQRLKKIAEFKQIKGFSITDECVIDPATHVRMFESRVFFGSQTSRAIARKRHLARIRASESMLQTLGYKLYSRGSSGNQQVANNGQQVASNGDGGRQPPETSKVFVRHARLDIDVDLLSADTLKSPHISPSQISTIAQQLLDGNQSQLAEQVYKEKVLPVESHSLENDYDKLRYIVGLLEGGSSCLKEHLKSDQETSQVMCAIELNEFVFCSQDENRDAARNTVARSLLTAMANRRHLPVHPPPAADHQEQDESPAESSSLSS